VQNEILRKRVCRLIASCYALSENDIWNYYVKIGSLDLLLNLLKTNKLDEYLK
jgi:hypothetical protein